MHENSYYHLDIKFKSFLKLRKIFPRFPSFRICPNAKYENSEISEISLTLLFCSKTAQKNMKTVTYHCESQLDIKFKSFLKLAKIFPTFPSFRIYPNAKYENSEISEISLTLLFCSKTVQKSMKTVTAIASHS